MTTISSSDCQVLVVGAGPTGLTLAAQLLARGISTRIIDKGSGPAGQSRALGIHARTLELLDSMGLAEELLARGHRVRHVRMYAGRRRLLDLDLAHNGSRYGFALHLPQSETEVVLRRRVRELGGTVEQGVRLVRLSDRGGAVEVTLLDGAGREVGVRADYVVGCDGAHSRVRHELGVPFEGRPYPQDWLLADVAMHGAGSVDAVHLFFRPDGLPVGCLPMGGHRWRLVMPNAGDRGGRQPSLEEIQDVVAQRCPWPVTISDPVWLASFRCHLRATTAYRRGRVLLAGDAAHIHSPAGGQGMNTGMLDAQNLAWKLALVVTRRAPDDLLDTYGQERLPVASAVMRFTDRVVGVLTMRSPVKRAIRAAVIPVATGLPAVQRRAARRLSQTSVRYPAGPLVRSGGERKGLRPGGRVPDVALDTSQGPSRLYDQLRAGRHVLVASSTDAAAGLHSAGVTLDGLVDVAVGRVPGGDLALVRPDGVLAARGPDRVTDYLRCLAPRLAPSEHPAAGTPARCRTPVRTARR